MSLNKILNRPMFRKEALRKGALKTINARTGRMVGMNVPGGAIDYVQKGGGFYDPKTGRLVGGLPVDPKSTNAPKPGIFQRIKSDIRNFPGGIKSDPIGTIKGTRPFGLGGGISRLLGFEGIYSAVDPYVGQYIQNPYGRMAASTGLSMLGAMNPYIRGAGVVKSVYDMGKAGLSKFNKDTAEYRAKPIGEKTSFSRMGDDEAGVFIPSIEQQVESDKKIVQGKPGGRVGFENRNKTLKAEGDPLLQDNVANSDDIADLDAVQENAVNIDSTGMPPGPPGSTDTLPTKSTTEVAEKDMSKDEKKNIEKENTAQGNNEIALGGPSDDVDFNKTIALAKKYQEEVFKNEGSQAGLVFLANLASGLLTGTTRRSGIAGAMEVFGQAIGPAVNNYATIKLKEGELRANNREASLNAAVDHMKFLNDAAIAKMEASVVERPDVDPGVVQFRGADGKLRNYRGYVGKGGTTYLPGGLGPDGKEQLIPISQSGPIKDSEGNVLGSFENFQKQDKINNRLFEISDILGNRYNALSVARDVLKTLNQMDASGEKVKAGAALAVDQFTRRLSGVAKELVGLNVLDNDISQMTLGALEDKMNKLQEDEFAAIDRSDLSDEAKKEAKEKINKDTLLEKARKKLKGRGILSGLTREEQEKLAVQEVTLTYALANTFKDQDRLTQRDVNAAKEIVNIFSLGRSSADVRASITAIANQLESDIRRQEELFRDAGGLESRITNLRGLAEFETFDKGTVESQLSKDLSLEEIENIIEGIN